LADPGGIAMSSFIYSQIENQLDLKGTYLPPQKLKNIPEKMRIFLVDPIGDRAPSRGRRGSPVTTKVIIGAVVVLAVVVVAWFFLGRS
ncbi:MAG TPA: hypothetical protein VG936_06730, partial [Lacunisphaera sp.]|nr:hypothetical protein [Lacunisphaera sp.]